MNVKINKLISTIIPSKKINYIGLFLLSLGIISGAIFLVVINQNDKITITTQINEFMSNINTNSINSVQALKNSLISNITYILLIWILGMSIIGILINIFATYIKGFILGFSITSLIYEYGIKGLLASFIYIFPHQLLNIMAILLVFIYSVMLTKYLFRIVSGDKTINIRVFLKKYFFILLISLGITLISSLFESFVTPALFKLIIKLFV